MSSLSGRGGNRLPRNGRDLLESEPGPIVRRAAALMSQLFNCSRTPCFPPRRLARSPESPAALLGHGSAVFLEKLNGPLRNYFVEFLARRVSPSPSRSVSIEITGGATANRNSIEPLSLSRAPRKTVDTFYSLITPKRASGENDRPLSDSRDGNFA